MVIDFIRVYSDSIESELSDSLINLFKSGECQYIDNNGTPTFSQININQSYPEYIKILSSVTLSSLKKYKEEFPDFCKWFPPRIFLEEFRIKKYNGGTSDRFDLHVDIQDHESSRRVLAFLFYLNDNYEGGETEFPYHSRKIQPKSGSVLVFPPNWQYPHAGLPVRKGTKYILSTYLHYY